MSNNKKKIKKNSTFIVFVIFVSVFFFYFINNVYTFAIIIAATKIHKLRVRRYYSARLIDRRPNDRSINHSADRGDPGGVSVGYRMTQSYIMRARRIHTFLYFLSAAVILTATTHAAAVNSRTDTFIFHF